MSTTPKPEPKMIPHNEHAGPVYLDDESFPSSNAGFFPNVRELVVALIQYNRPLPIQIEACDVRGPATPNAMDHIRSELEAQEFFSEAHETVTAERVEQLQALLALWWDNCGVKGWFPNGDHIAFSNALAVFIREQSEQRAALPPEERWSPIEGLDAFFAPKAPTS
jgi:hypothetical protein